MGKFLSRKVKERYIGPYQAATILRVARRTVYGWMESGKMPYCKTVKGHRRILKTDFLNFLIENFDNTDTLGFTMDELLEKKKIWEEENKFARDYFNDKFD